MLTAGEVQVVFPDEGAALNYLSPPYCCVFR